jgi:preprotein translocase subunit SecD
MSKGLTWRISLIVFFLFCSLLYLAPTLFAPLPSWWDGPFLPKDKINLGLDLQGGIHLVMEVETQKAVEGQLDIIATDVEDTLNSKNLRFKKVTQGDRCLRGNSPQGKISPSQASCSFR